MSATYETARIRTVFGEGVEPDDASPFSVRRNGEHVAYLSIRPGVPFDGELAAKVAAVFAEHEAEMADESDIAPPAMPDGPQPGEVWVHDGERITIDSLVRPHVVAAWNAGVLGWYLTDQLTRPPVVADSLNIWVCAGAAGNRLWTGSAGCPDDRPAGRLHVWSDGDVTWEPTQ